MGMYDDVEVKCINCGELNLIQTKVLGNCSLLVYQKSKKICAEEFFNCVFQLKGDCEKCGEKIKIKIQDSVIQGTTKEEPDYIEGHFGSVFPRMEEKGE